MRLQNKINVPHQTFSFQDVYSCRVHAVLKSLKGAPTIIPIDAGGDHGGI